MIFIIFNVFFHNLDTNCGKDLNKINSKSIKSENIIQIENEKDKKTNENVDILNWYIEIPAINLKAPIKETTNMNVLDEYLGHFNETSKTDGNIGIAGHNRGYSKNYFENLKVLKIGDEIKYKYNDYENNYKIVIIKTIKSTNWSYLEKTNDNRITLITCVNNKPELRLCIQGVQK